MGLFSIFDNHERGKRLSHIKNLIEVGFADGKFDGAEYDLLRSIAKRLDFSEEEIKKISDNPELVSFSPPSSYEQKVLQLFDLVKMVLADKEIHESEVNICKSLAIKLNLAPMLVDDIISTLISGIIENRDDEELFNELMKKIG